MERKICFDRATLDNKIILDDDDYLVMPAVIASEIVHQYEDGWAYKPAEELEKMAKTATDIGAVPVKILHHPGSESYDLLLRHEDVHGRAENFRYVKNLVDSKTKRPCRKGVRADIRWFKDRVPEPVIEQIKNTTMHDVSIGFTQEKDFTSGEWNGTHYDYIQRNIFLQHLAAPIEKGRCPGPVCGIGFDKQIQITGDPWEETEENIRSGHKESSEECRTIEISESEGIKAVYCKYGEKWDIQSYLFSKAKGWTMEKAKSWFNNHKDQGLDEVKAVVNCVICKQIDSIGVLETVKRLVKAYGKDVFYVIKGAEPLKPTETDEDVLLDAKKTIDSAMRVLEE
jgi:hypothetical protein